MVPPLDGFLTRNRRIVHELRVERRTNPFTGERLRMERSPGNIWLRSSTNGFEMIWFDFDGAPGFTNEVFRFDGAWPRP